MTVENFILPKSTDLDRSRHIGRVVEELESLPLDQAWKVSIEEKKPPRSLDANAYYWGCVVEMFMNATGYEKDEVHDLFCGERWGWKDKPVPKTPRNPLGIESKPIRTTTRDEHGRRSVLTGGPFAEFVDFARRYAERKMDLVIPDPDQNWREHAA